MERTTISLPRDVIVALRVMAAERRTSMAEIIRDAVEEKLNRELAATTAVSSKKTVKRPKPTSIGIFDSGYTDTSLLASEGPVPPVSWR